MKRYFLAAIVATLFAGNPASAMAQYGQQTSNGMFGSRNTGGGISGASGGSSSSLNPQAGQLSGGDANLRNVQGFVGAGSEGGFIGQAGATASGTGQMGMGGLGTSRGMGTRGMSGMGTGGLGMGGLGGSRGLGMSGLGTTGLGGFGGNQFGGFQQNQFGGRNNRFGSTGGQAAQQRVPFRTTMRVGFEVPMRDTSSLSATLTRRLERSSMLQSRSRLSVEMSGQTAVLRGTVASEHDRELAERVVLLEPGVNRVENRLAVSNSAASN